ncbi:hypothetical protein G9A89_006897 [Geosiphon pyriformis]|nr:hypothetical protein G9A89_006897 [Geosiphon pyriformis]
MVKLGATGIQGKYRVTFILHAGHMSCIAPIENDGNFLCEKKPSRMYDFKSVKGSSQKISKSDINDLGTPTSKSNQALDNIKSLAVSVLGDALPTSAFAITRSLASLIQDPNQKLEPGASSQRAFLRYPELDIDKQPANLRMLAHTQNNEDGPFQFRELNLNSININKMWDNWASTTPDFDSSGYNFSSDESDHIHKFSLSSPVEFSQLTSTNKTQRNVDYVEDGTEVLSFLNSGEYTHEVYKPFDMDLFELMEGHSRHFSSNLNHLPNAALSYLDGLLETEDIMGYLSEIRYSDDIYGLPEFFTHLIHEAKNEISKNKGKEVDQGNTDEIHQTAIERLRMLRNHLVETRNKNKNSGIKKFREVNGAAKGETGSDIKTITLKDKRLERFKAKEGAKECSEDENELIWENRRE